MTVPLALKLVTVFVLSFVFIKLIIRYAPALGLVDIPNHRSIHTKVIPRGAGIGMIFAVIFSDLIFYNTTTFSHLWTLVGIFLVFIVGVLDDHRDASPKVKFLVIFVAVALFYQDNIVIDSWGTIFGYHIKLGWFSLPFTMFAVAGFTNALNLSDGLDGLAGSLSVVILLALCYIGFTNHDMFMVSLSLSFIASILAFLWFNWNPAQIFMGDSGSLTLGAVISVLSIKALDYIPHASILFIAAIPILDTLIVMIRRKRTGTSVFSPDQTHLHHVLLRFFSGDVKRAVILIILIQLFYSWLGLNFANNGYKQGYIIMIFVLLLVIFYIVLNGMLQQQKKKSYKGSND
jgi:UDP-GlcNAc:undecaprenyl-phosphate GlcNAc-1-phosphate transferase